MNESLIERSSGFWPFSRPGRSPAARALRGVAYFLLFAAVVTPVIQFQVQSQEAWQKDRAIEALSPAERAAVGPIKTHHGAIERWMKAIGLFWEGRNIYVSHDRAEEVGVWLHPNSPGMVVLMSPLALLPGPMMALVFNILKVAALLAAIYMAAELANPSGRKLPDWVLGLGLLWSILLVVGDIQHGNTNTFVLAAIVAHAYLYRKGHDTPAGAMLALAIGLKMTPALFLLYWLYQREWKLLGATVLSLVLLLLALPVLAMGWGMNAPSWAPVPLLGAALLCAGYFLMRQRSRAVAWASLAGGLGVLAAGAMWGWEPYSRMMGSWLGNLIGPGLVRGAWYPIHVNQSLPGVFSRYFFDRPNPNGNIYWNPDDYTYVEAMRHNPAVWIALADLPGWAVKGLLRGAQLLVVGVCALAIGWKRLPRTDGRRALHVGLICLAMLLLNQRTWDHHAAILIPGAVALWAALAFGRMSRRLRRLAVLATVGAGPFAWLAGTALYKFMAKIVGEDKHVAEYWSDIAEARGPTFWYFVLMFTILAAVTIALRRNPLPYAETRQTFGGYDAPKGLY